MSNLIKILENLLPIISGKNFVILQLSRKVKAYF